MHWFNLSALMGFILFISHATAGCITTPEHGNFSVAFNKTIEGYRGVHGFGAANLTDPVDLSYLKYDHDLDKFNSTIHDRAGPKVFCGIFNTGDRRDAHGIANWLHYAKHQCGAPAKTCRRQACYNTSAIYICNDNNYAITVPCELAASYADYINGFCCTHAISGQYFHPTARFNVIVAYGNCRHDHDADRPSYGPAPDIWGPNGKC